jgi:26S proteasome regulatory subunit N2
LQPTGGVILVTDTTPSEPKTLIEFKARKPIKHVVAPGEAAQAGDAGASAVGGGAAAAAGVLNAVDEDSEGGEEAPLPTEFEYDTDGDDEQS